jgi:hypothetical protein
MTDLIATLRAEADQAESFIYLNHARRLRSAADEIDRLCRKLIEIHEITQDPHVPSVYKVDNIAATASSALSSPHYRSEQ